MKNRKILFAAGGVAIAAAAALAHEGHKAISTKGVLFGPRTGSLLLEPLARKAVGLTTAKVDFGAIEETLRVPARVVLPWDRQGFASARVPGVVASVRVKPGDFVQAGEILAELSSLELKGLQLDLVQRLLEKKFLEQNLARIQALGERIIAGREVLELETELKDKENEVRVIARRLEAFGLSKAQVGALSEKGETADSVAIVAPLAGAVVHVDLPVGAPVDPMKHLVEIHDLSQVWVQGEVPESRISRVKAGMAVRMKFPAYPDREWTAQIVRMGSAVSEESRTLPVWAAVENADFLLKPGLFGQMSVVTGISEDAAVAPARAIIEDGAEKYVLVIEKENAYVRVEPKDRIEEYASEPKAGYFSASAFAKRNVVLGRSDGLRVEVLDGVLPGDSVVVDAGHELSSLYAQGVLKLSEEAKKNIGVATAEVDLRPVGEVVRLNATLRAPVGRLAFGSSRIDGKVLKILAVAGQEVEAGAVLAEVSSLEFESLQSDYYRAALRERLLRTLAEQLRLLGDIAPRKELLQAETKHARELGAAANLRNRLRTLGVPEAALDGLAESGEMLRSLPVLSPIGGRIAEVDAVPGKVVKADEHLFQIVDGRALWAEAMLFERDFQAVLQGEAGKEVILRASGRETKARISFTAQSMVSHERSLPVFAEIQNEDGGFLPGMTCEMLVEAGRSEKPVIAAPNRAILTVGARSYAFVAEGGTFKRVPVEIGRRDAEFAEILAGLFPGDLVAVSGVNDLNTAINTLR